MQGQWSLLPTPTSPTHTHTHAHTHHSASPLPLGYSWQLRDPRELNSHTLQGGNKCPRTPGGHCPGSPSLSFNLEGPGWGEGGGV